MEKLCKVWRAYGSGKGIVVDPSETELAYLGYFVKDNICHYCNEKGHLRNNFPKLAQKQHSDKNCKCPGCTTPATHGTAKCWKDLKN